MSTAALNVHLRGRWIQSGSFIRPRIKETGAQTFSRTETRVNVVDGGPVDCHQSPADGGLVGGFLFLWPRWQNGGNRFSGDQATDAQQPQVYL